MPFLGLYVALLQLHYPRCTLKVLEKSEGETKKSGLAEVSQNFPRNTVEVGPRDHCGKDFPESTVRHEFFFHQQKSPKLSGNLKEGLTRRS
jgi:hypothetical protein